MSNINSIIEKAINSLGKGFDLTCDFRLKYCKGDERLVLLNETVTKEIIVPGFGAFNNVPVDIKCDKGDRVRFQSDILTFNQMSEFMNRKSSVAGKIPSGLFNSMFGFQSGSWATDAANTNYLGLDGYFIILFDVHIDRSPLLLSDQVINAVPSTWDPAALARFIEKYGTHIIVGLSIGGQDVVLVRQDKLSNMEPSQLKNQLDELGDQLFTGICNFSPHQCKTREQKHKALEAFNIFDPQPNIFSDFPSATTKDGVTVICSKRGGDLTAKTHSEWLLTVASKPDAIGFNFIPITSLLKSVPGKGFLSHAINLYLRYKPPIADLQYFLDFQAHKMWAPVHSDLPLGPTTNRSIRPPALHFNLMGPKLYVNPTQVIVGKTPVTGMRLYLEGVKCDRLAIHLQHLLNTPVLLQDKIDEPLTWSGSEDVPDHDRYSEAIQWKKFSHVCTAPVKYDPKWTSSEEDLSFIVTGAQLHVKKHETKSILHLRLLYSKVSNSCIVQSQWMQCDSESCTKSGSFLSAGLSVKEKTPLVVVDSGVYPTGPPVPLQTQKLLKFVDTTQLCRGPLDSPGHWLVTGAKLDLERGKICLRVKFSLLNMSS
ncbi:PREDICTED: MACPF domain-containing protein At1g14780 [Nicotiana attenuata]|uniref:Macpf domain-containing protein n=1 Tax=Nicotiana attenuata TaxID=49451 RepID=A0A314LF68_NICAT|nr:PREDICTED: MACPF domain-containing protein At1g14780 [Nicotiana attenuata]OIT40401.1 macpf domain-containing protein [Nicotiana attenuata]